MTREKLLYSEGDNSDLIKKLEEENEMLKKENLKLKSILTQISRKMDFVVTTFI